jgi:HPt (histidine-containing phosphotransfer) domain-containing protein
MDFHEAFRDEGAKIVDDLDSAAKKQDFNEVGQQAHKLKGSALTIGYPEVAATTSKIESLCKKNEASRALLLIPKLKRQMSIIDNLMVEYFSMRSELNKSEKKKDR